jgi:hypothetical protein
VGLTFASCREIVSARASAGDRKILELFSNATKRKNARLAFTVNRERADFRPYFSREIVLISLCDLYGVEPHLDVATWEMVADIFSASG